MTRDPHHTATGATLSEESAWTAAARFLDAFGRRDFDSLLASLDPDVRFRALVPRGPISAVGATALVGYLRRWFGGDDGFTVEDASIGQLYTSIYLRWRVRMCAAQDRTTRVVEQHAFATAGSQIESLDLLCSGFFAD